jgi:hypothetical protein
VKGNFFGEKNGKKIGILLNIAQKDAQEINIKLKI